jgi:hypothetical protein
MNRVGQNRDAARPNAAGDFDDGENQIHDQRQPDAGDRGVGGKMGVLAVAMVVTVLM